MNDDVLCEIKGGAMCLQTCCQKWLSFVKNSEREKHASLAKALQYRVPGCALFKSF